MNTARELDILQLDQITRSDTELVGTTAASLGELQQAGFRVPAGFVVTAHAYHRFLQESGLKAEINKLLRDLAGHDVKTIHAAAAHLQRAITRARLPTDLEEKLQHAYRAIYHQHKGAAFVEIRPSFIDEDSHSDIAHEQATFVNVLGADSLVRGILHVWAALFSADALDYRQHLGIDYLAVQPAVLVRFMAPAHASGVALTTNPLRDQVGDEVIIEAIYGLPSPLLLGAVDPDRFVVSRRDKKILEKDVQAQAWQLVRAQSRAATGVRHQAVAKTYQKRPKLSDEQVLVLAGLADKIHDHFQLPQHIEWALDQQGSFWVLDSWPMAQAAAAATPVSGSSDSVLLARGLAGSLAVAVGPVRVIRKPADIDQARSGEVVVAQSLTPAQIVKLKHAAGIVLEAGGLTSHSLIAAREMGIPCMVGATNATGRVKAGLIVTLDGHTARLYRGKVLLTTHAGDRFSDLGAERLTATKLLVNLADAETAVDVAAQSVDGVGLVRGEFLLAELGVHPHYLLQEKKDQLLSRHVTKQLRAIAAAFSGQPVIYRAMDLRTDSARGLEGGAKIEPVEPNPMLGYRGAARLLREPELFQLELRVLKDLRDNHNFRNLHLMLPFVRTVDEFIRLANLVDDAGLRQAPDFELWMMAEVPSNVILIQDFLAAGVDGISLGSSDLTQLMLGVDRDNPKMSSDFDERNPAVVAALTHIVRACRQKNIPVSLSGEAAGTRPELIEDLLAAGLTSLSVDADALRATRQLITSIERQMLLNELTLTAHGHSHPVWQ